MRVQLHTSALQPAFLQPVLTRPDTIRIILDRPIGAEFAHGKGGSDRLLVPFAMIASPELINQRLSLDVRSEVVRDLPVSFALQQLVQHSRGNGRARRRS